MIENELVRRMREIQESVLKEGCTEIPENDRKNWVKLNKPVALMSCTNGNSIRVGQTVHATEVRLDNDEVRLQESASITGLSFNFDLASNPEALGRTLGLPSGTKVKTIRPYSADSEWDEKVRLTRRWGVNGTITGCRRSPALYYDVLHSDGTSSCYFPTEVA